MRWRKGIIWGWERPAEDATTNGVSVLRARRLAWGSPKHLLYEINIGRTEPRLHRITPMSRCRIMTSEEGGRVLLTIFQDDVLNSPKYPWDSPKRGRVPKVPRQHTTAKYAQGVLSDRQLCSSRPQPVYLTFSTLIAWLIRFN